MIESEEWKGWFQGIPDKKGRYLVIDAAFWFDRIADWIPGDKGRPGRWYMDGRPSGDASTVAFFRPVPKMPIRPEANLAQGPTHA